MIYVATVHIYLQRRAEGVPCLPPSIIRSESKIPYAYRPRTNRHQGGEGGQDQVQDGLGNTFSQKITDLLKQNPMLPSDNMGSSSYHPASGQTACPIGY